MQAYNQKKARVLHISTHIGGGIGTVLLNYLAEAEKKSYFSHSVITLGYTEDKTRAAVKKMGISYMDNMASDHKTIIAEIEKSDIVLIHWWNHPLIYDFLVRNLLPKSRVIIWSHVAGFHSPQIFTDKLLAYPDIFVFTTPISLETRDVKNFSDGQKKLRVVFATGGVKHVESIKPKKHIGFNIGYIGTVDYAKIHHNFLSICNKIRIPNVRFIVCGGSNEKEIRKESERLGIAKKFNFTGRITDIKKYLSIFDIFGYPLSPHHYGTCDQVLIESMATGIVPVVLDNRMEKYMIMDGITGIVSKNEDEYVKAIHKLYRNKSLRHKMSQSARKYAHEVFSIKKMAETWERIFEELLTRDPTYKKWCISKKNTLSATDIFLESLGDYGEVFHSYCNAKSKDEKMKAIEKIKKFGESTTWQSTAKGTVHNYSSYFIKDRLLSRWSKLMRSAQSAKNKI